MLQKPPRNLVHGVTIFHKKGYEHYILKWDTFEYKYHVFAVCIFFRRVTYRKWVVFHTPRWSQRLCKSPDVCVNPSKQLYVSVSLKWFPVVAYVILTIVRLLSSHRTSEIRILQLTNHENSATGWTCCQSISHQRKTPNNGIQKKPKGVTRGLTIIKIHVERSNFSNHR